MHLPNPHGWLWQSELPSEYLAVFFHRIHVIAHMIAKIELGIRRLANATAT